MKTTKFQLFKAFFNGLPLTIESTTFQVINEIQREDGSNNCYNITGVVNGHNKPVFVRTTY